MLQGKIRAGPDGPGMSAQTTGVGNLGKNSAGKEVIEVMEEKGLPGKENREILISINSL